MTRIYQTLDSLVSNELSKNIIPVKTPDGILVGDVIIISEGPIKHLKQRGVLVYKDISLNTVAIALANQLALHKRTVEMDKLWAADQEYGRWYIDSQMLRSQYQRSVNNKDFDRADMLWSRYCESRDRAMIAKTHTERLVRF